MTGLTAAYMGRIGIINVRRMTGVANEGSVSDVGGMILNDCRGTALDKIVTTATGETFVVGLQ